MDPRLRKAFDQQAKIMKDLNKHMSPLLQVLNDPAFKQAHLDTRWIAAERSKALATMPDAETRKTLATAAQYFNSKEFRAQREALTQASEAMRGRLGAEGMTAAHRIAGRRLRAPGNQERTDETVTPGEALQLLEDATNLASSIEVRETIEQADAASLVQLDATEAAQNDTATGDLDSTLEFGDLEEEPELSKEELLEINRSAVQLFLILSTAVAAILVVSSSGLSLPVLLTMLNGLAALSQWSEIEITKWEEDDS